MPQVPDCATGADTRRRRTEEVRGYAGRHAAYFALQVAIDSRDKNVARLGTDKATVGGTLPSRQIMRVARVAARKVRRMKKRNRRASRHFHAAAHELGVKIAQRGTASYAGCSVEIMIEPMCSCERRHHARRTDEPLEANLTQRDRVAAWPAFGQDEHERPRLGTQKRALRQLHDGFYPVIAQQRRSKRGRAAARHETVRHEQPEAAAGSGKTKILRHEKNFGARLRGYDGICQACFAENSLEARAPLRNVVRRVTQRDVETGSRQEIGEAFVERIGGYVQVPLGSAST